MHNDPARLPQVLAWFNQLKRPPRIALVRQLGDGAFMRRWQTGAQTMAAMLGMDLHVKSAQDDQARVAPLIAEATTEQFDAIIVSHGDSTTAQPAIAHALAAGIKVVTFDLVVNHPDVPEVEQDDLLIGFLLARQVAADYQGNAQVIVVSSDTLAPLIKRERVWQDFKWRYPKLAERARVDRATNNAAADARAAVSTALAEHADANVVLALWDELAKGAVQAVESAGAAERVKVYGVDIADEDIATMVRSGSPWVATVATDPANIGRLAVRAAAALVVGEPVAKYLLVEPQLVTQQFLRAERITTLEALVARLPALGESELVWYDWMHVVAERNGYGLPRFGDWAERALGESEARLRQIVDEQQSLIETIRVLSTPVIPIHDGLLVVPLVGHLDAARSDQITETLLDAVQQHRASMVIIDITGVPLVDTQSAAHLLRMTRAAALLGAECVLVGLSPEIAQTVVQLGLDLQSIKTYRNLRAGLDYALRRQGLQIAPLAAPSTR